MKSHVAFLAALTGLLLLPLSGRATPTARCTARCAYRTGTICTAPAYVHVDCIGDGTSETTDSDPAVRPFHDLGYQIDYGDSACSSGQGTWTNSAVNHPKNVDYEPIGAHVYECPGTFTINTMVTSPSGVVSTTQDTVTIEAEDVGWSGANTKCVANGATPQAGVGGCPVGAAILVGGTTDFDAEIQTGAGKRTLFKCGDTFTINANPPLADATSNGSLVAGYGDCASSKVRVKSTNSTSYLSSGLAPQANFNGWRFRDLSFTAGAPAGSTTLLKPHNVVVSKVLFLRIDQLNMGACHAFYRGHGESGGDSPLWSELSAMVSVKCQVTSASSDGPFWTGLYGLGWKYGAFIDSQFIWEPTVGDNITANRLMGVDHTFFAHVKMIYRSTASGANLSTQFRSADGVIDRPTQWNVLADWTDYDGGGASAAHLSWSTGHGLSGTLEELNNHDFIADGYRRIIGPTKAGCDNIPIAVGTPGVTIRNSILVDRFNRCDGGLAWVNGRAADWRDGSPSVTQPHDASVYNNTIVFAPSGGATMAVMGTSDTWPGNYNGDTVMDGSRARNNIVYDTASGGGTTTTTGFACTDCVAGQNVHSATPSCPFVGSDGACAMTNGVIDNCPTVANPDQANADGDALGDACDPCPNDATNDADGDGVCGAVDNCPGFANASQADSGGLRSTTPDGVGDACQCGDVSSNGVIDAVDLGAFRSFLADPFATGFDPAKCRVSGTPGLCSILDASVLARALAQTGALAPGISQSCDAARR